MSTVLSMRVLKSFLLTVLSIRRGSCAVRGQWHSMHYHLIMYSWSNLLWYNSKSSVPASLTFTARYSKRNRRMLRSLLRKICIRSFHFADQTFCEPGWKVAAEMVGYRYVAGSERTSMPPYYYTRRAGEKDFHIHQLMVVVGLLSGNGRNCVDG